MKKNLFIIVITIGVAMLLQSCDPARNCNEPSCLYSDVSTNIEVNLSGNLDSVISVGDTIELSMKIPNSLITNYETVELGSIKRNSFFGIISSGFDSISPSKTLGFHPLEPMSIIYDKTTSGKDTWNYNSREYKCLFIPKEKGRYRIDVMGGRLEVIASNGKEWLINPVLIWDGSTATKVRINQYLQWIDISLRAETAGKLAQKTCWYNFEVK